MLNPGAEDRQRTRTLTKILVRVLAKTSTSAKPGQNSAPVSEDKAVTTYKRLRDLENEKRFPIVCL